MEATWQRHLSDKEQLIHEWHHRETRTFLQKLPFHNALTMELRSKYHSNCYYTNQFINRLTTGKTLQKHQLLDYRRLEFAS